MSLRKKKKSNDSDLILHKQVKHHFQIKRMQSENYQRLPILKNSNRLWVQYII